MAPDQDRETDQDSSGSLGAAGWIALATLSGFLGWAIWYAIHAWGMLSGVGISRTGWVFLVLGVVVTIIVGSGLMALLFYSSRKGRDF
jgi:hypothetical protein